MDYHDLVMHGIQFGDNLGAKYIELRYIDAVNESYNTTNGQVLAAGSSSPTGIGIRALVNGGMSFVSTAQLTKKGVEDAVSTAIKLAKATKRKTPIVFSEEEVVETSWKSPIETKFTDVSSEIKLNRLTELDKELVNAVGEGALPNRNAFVVLETHKKLFANNEGTKIEAGYSVGFIYLMLTAKNLDKTEQRFIGRGGTFGWEWFSSPNFIETFVEEAKAIHTVVQKAKARKFDTPIDMIIGPEVAGIIAHENAGHPSELDRIKGREAAEAGESYWADVEIGTERTGSTAVTVIDDPSIPGSGGYYKYDDEGVKSRARYLIKEGIITEPLTNRQFAGQIGVKSNASARSIGFNREPLVRMANTYIEAGDFTTEELLEDIKLGVFMENFTEWNIDDRRYQSKYVGCAARLIKDGEITDEYISRPTLELTSRGLFNSIDASGKGFSPDLATCGKSNPGQGIPVWTAGPADGVRMRNIRLGGI